MDTPKEENLIRKIFQNEIVWIATIILALWGFVINVILPLQKVQIQLTEIEANIADNKILYQQALAEHQALNARVDILETQIKPLLK